jgi:hypothetical protein
MRSSGGSKAAGNSDSEVVLLAASPGGRASPFAAAADELDEAGPWASAVRAFLVGGSWEKLEPESESDMEEAGKTGRDGTSGWMRRRRADEETG